MLLQSVSACSANRQQTYEAPGRILLAAKRKKNRWQAKLVKRDLLARAAIMACLRELDTVEFQKMRAKSGVNESNIIRVKYRLA
jgi:hypothetical protein